MLSEVVEEDEWLDVGGATAARGAWADGVDGVEKKEEEEAEEESAMSGGYKSFMICDAVGSWRWELTSGEKTDEEEAWHGRCRVVWHSVWLG